MAPGEAILGVVFFMSVASIFVLRGPLGRALADRIAGRGGPEEGVAAERAARALEELEDVKHRLAELEERQDFTERVLSRDRDPGRLPAGE